MTEQGIRQVFRSLKQRWLKHERPTFLHIAYDKEGQLQGAEIRAFSRVLWAWPDGYQSGIDEDKIRHSFTRHTKKRLEASVLLNDSPI